MWPNDPYENSNNEMKKAITKYREENSKAKTVKFISRNYGYTITAAAEYLMNL